MIFWHLYNFYSPAFIALVFVGLSIYDVCTTSSVSRAYAFSGRWRPIAFLSFVITLTFIARVIERMFSTPEVIQSSLSHALSQTLIWITLVLITLTASFPAPIPHLTTWLLSFFVEASICAATFVLSRQARLNQITTAQLTLQLLTVVQILVLSIFGVVALCTKPSVSRNAERQPLLADMDTSTRTSVTYSDDDFSQASSDDDVQLSDDEDDNSEDSSSDTDEKELKAIRQHKLQEAGGWVGYLKSFKVFIPFVVPTRNPKLQLYVAIILLITLLERALNVIHPYQLGLVIDKLTTTRRIPWANVVLWMVSTAAASSGSGLGAITDMLQERLAAWSHQQIKVAAYDKIMGLSMNFHDSKESGEIMKAVEQAGALSSLFRLFVLDILPGLLDVVIAMWFMSQLLDFYATHIVIAVVVAFVFTTVFISRLTAQARRTVSGRERDESKLFYETIGNWSTVSYFNRKQHEISRVAKAVAQVASSEIRSNDVYALLFAVQDACELLGYFAVLLRALYRIVANTSSIGTFITLENYWETITMPLYNLGYSYRQVSSDMVDAERLIQLFEIEASVKDKHNAYPITVCKSEVEFNNVTFAYDGRTNTIHNLTFKARPGQKIAFVGETGSGKSTIFKLVMRFFDLNGGRITIDGQNIADVTIDSLREVFGIVPQDPILFNTSILENVRYGRLDATDTEVFDACKGAFIHDKILSFPDGYQSKCGERGVKLSGGERQRIAIARVLLKRPKVVLLDEATSAMDSRTEEQVGVAMKALMKGRTTFVIAHRLSSVVDADVIFVMKSGRIVEAGTHSELLNVKGTYFELWTKQSAQKQEGNEGDLSDTPSTSST